MQLPAISFAWFNRLSPREKMLTALTGGAALFVINLLLLNLLLNMYTGLSQQYADGKRDLLRLNFLASTKPMWTARNAWLQAKQPALTNRDRAGVALLDEVQGVGRAQQVIVTGQIKPPGSLVSAAAPSLGAGSTAAAPEAVTVEIDTQGDWKETVHFLAALQQPEKFLVFDLSNLRSNPADPKQMKGHFLISKWYAPLHK